MESVEGVEENIEGELEFELFIATVVGSRCFADRLTGNRSDVRIPPVHLFEHCVSFVQVEDLWLAGRCWVR